MKNVGKDRNHVFLQQIFFHFAFNKAVHHAYVLDHYHIINIKIERLIEVNGNLIRKKIKNYKII